MTFKSECYTLARLASDSGWIDASLDDQQKLNHGYRLRDPEVSFYLPRQRPSLPSGEVLEDRCGPIKYRFRNSALPTYANGTQIFEYTEPPYYGETSCMLSVESNVEELVKDLNNFEFYWNTVLDAYVYEYWPSIIWTYPNTLQFRITDYCLGWTMSRANITFDKASTVFDA